MMSIAYCEGQFAREEQILIPITDRGFLYGHGVFTTVRVTDGKTEFWQQHMQRLAHDCSLLNIPCPHVDPELVHELIRRNDALRGIWRLKIIITAGSGKHLDMRRCEDGRLLLMLAPYEEMSGKPCTLTIYPEPLSRPLSKIKSLAYLDRLCVSDYAQSKGFDDAIVTNAHAQVLETAFSNIFWCRDGSLYTPGFDLQLIPGVFLASLIDAAQASGMQIFKTPSVVDQIPSDANLFICNVLTHIRPVISIDGRPFPRNPTLEQHLAAAIWSARAHKR